MKLHITLAGHAIHRHSQGMSATLPLCWPNGLDAAAANDNCLARNQVQPCSWLGDRSYISMISACKGVECPACCRATRNLFMYMLSGSGSLRNEKLCVKEVSQVGSGECSVAHVSYMAHMQGKTPHAYLWHVTASIVA